jgi:hypothetical protein
MPRLSRQRVRLGSVINGSAINGSAINSVAVTVVGQPGRRDTVPRQELPPPARPNEIMGNGRA